MKTHTSNFKQNVKLFGRELNSIITYELDGDTIELGVEELNSITPSYDGSLLKSVMKQLKIDSNEEIPLNTVVNYQFGVKVNNSFEYLDFGNYIVYKTEKKEDTDSWEITCYDKMLYSMKEYEILSVTYPVTIRSYLNAICTHLGLTFANASDTFPNYDKEIHNELYLDTEGNNLGYTFRDVLDQISEVVAGTICINDNDQLEIRYLNDTQDTINEEFLKDVNVKFGEKYGPVNSIVISRASESDNVYLQDEESVEENGLTEIKIKENQILNFNDRSDYLEDILDQLNGLEYYVNDFSSTGITYYDLCDMYNIQIGDNTYNCIMLNDEINVTQGLEENIYTETLEQSETDYTKADKTDRKLNQTYIIANKQEGQITALTSRTETLEGEMGDRYTKEQVNELIQTAETGLTNTFSEAGGNNIFRNTGLWFSATTSEATVFPAIDLYPSEELFMGNKVVYEFWAGDVQKKSNDKAVNMTSMLLVAENLSQEQTVPNNNYVVSFKYKKLIELANVSVKINDVTYSLTETDDTEFVQTIEVNSQHINIQFITDIDKSCEIYDLMVNVGTTKLAYSQNQNETTTDTVNISKGITITSSNTDTIFKANSDGIRTLDKSGNELTKFTDTGMTTKKMIVEDTSQIVGTLWQEVGEQTWITRL